MDDFLKLLELPDDKFLLTVREVCEKAKWRDWEDYTTVRGLSLADLAFRLRDEILAVEYGYQYWKDGRWRIGEKRQKEIIDWDVWSTPPDWIVAAIIARRLSEVKE